MRIGHASISENRNNGRDGKAQAGDQTGKEVCIREFYSKPWKFLLRCKDANKAEKMAKACESICRNECVGYDQLERLSLNRELSKIGYQYEKLRTKCECDCSSFMTVCAQCAGIQIRYPSGNAPTTSNMVKLFQETGQFDLITEGINDTQNLKRGDILVGPPATHTVMVLDDGVKIIQKMKTLRRGSQGQEVIYLQKILVNMGYDIGRFGVDGNMGKDTEKAVKQFQGEHGLVIDGIVGVKTWAMLEKYT